MSRFISSRCGGATLKSRTITGPSSVRSFATHCLMIRADSRISATRTT